MYKVTFSDNTEFKGGNPEKSLWNDMPDKPIKKLTYFLVGKGIIFDNYESYNHIVERAYNITKGNERITRLLIMGKTGKFVDILVLNFAKNKIETLRTNFGTELNGQPTTGWKAGIIDLERPAQLLINSRIVNLNS